MSPGIDSPLRVATGRVGFNENSLSHCRSTRGKASIPPSLDTSTHGAVGGTRVLIASNKMSFYIILCHFGELQTLSRHTQSTCFGFKGIISGVPYKEPAPQAHLSSASEKEKVHNDLRG